MAGPTGPSYYFIERMQGFGRKVASKIPYRPPPGLNAEEAMIRARKAAEGTDDAEDGDG